MANHSKADKSKADTGKLLKQALRELKKSREPIAVIGMGCRLPGGVSSPEQLWQLLENGDNAITDMVDERWNGDEFYDPDPEAIGKLYTKANGLVSDVDQFDAEFFGITPMEAKLMEPQQRLLLETTWNALENAGIAADTLAGSKTGVFVGICHMGYSHMQAQYCSLEDISPYNGTGNSHSVASGRISYLLGLQGPSLSVDTACSSSLVSIHLAVQSLRKGESDLAMASGVNLILEPTTSMIFARAGMLSPDGLCKTFDDSANGYVRGEGCGTLVLKRLSDAVRDGDSVLAVIRGSAVNQDGKSQGITAPNELAQEKVLKAALQDAGVKPEEVSYIEAHGTGTPLGDPIELAALNTVYGKERSNKLTVGSIKTNMGHLEAAAGVAGFMKLVLSIQHQQIPRHLHFSKPNQYIDWNSIAIDVPAEGKAWESEKRIGAVSSFGFSGTNCHIIVEQAPIESETAETAEQTAPEHAVAANAPALLPLSAKSEAALQAYVQDYADALQQPELQQAPWESLCYTAATGRNAFRYRAVIEADSASTASDQLNQLLSNGSAPGIRFGNAATSAPKIAFAFTGQGAQYAGMGQALYETNTSFRQALDEVAALMANELEQPLFSVLWGDNSNLLDQTQYTQPAIFAIQYALMKTWSALGVQASCVTGHSIGEYAAAVYAGVMTLADAVTLICARGRLMHTVCEPGAMAAVFASGEDTRQALDTLDMNITVAAVNGPRNCVIAGEPAAVEQATALLSDMQIKTRELSVSHAFHSPMMEPMLAPFAEQISGVQLKAPRIRFISSKTGKTATQDVRQAQYWVDHVRDTVQFLQAGQSLAEQNIQCVIEIGPGANLVKLLPQCMNSEQPCEMLHSLDRDASEDKHFHKTIADLYLQGAAVQWGKLFVADSGSAPKKVALPTYPYQRQSYWVDKIRLGNYSKDSGGALGKLSYQWDWIAAELSNQADQGNARFDTILLLDTAPEFSAQLKESLQAAVKTMPEFENQAVEIIPLPLDSAENLRASISDYQTKAEEKQLSLPVVIAAPKAVPQSDTELNEVLRSAHQQGDRLLLAAQALASDGHRNTPAQQHNPVRIWCVSENGYRDDQPNLAAYPTLGFAKSAALEWGERWGGMVDLNSSNDAAIQGQQLLNEIMHPANEDAVRFNGQQRQVLRLNKGPLPNPDLSSLSDQATYLVTGGLGGLGLYVAEALVQSGARHLIMMSRSSTLQNLSDSAKQQVEKLQQQGATVSVFNGDVADRDCVNDLITQLNSSDYPLKGIVHAAGVSGMSLSHEMSADEWQRVTRAKIDGAVNLHLATQALSLDFFVMFSSIASVWGSGGMAHYAAANHFLDGMVAWRNARDLPASGFNWGPWGEAGMATGAAAEESARRGLLPLAPEQAVYWLSHSWQSDKSHQVVVDADWQRFREILEMQRPHPMFGTLGRSLSATSAATGEKSPFFKSLYPLAVEERQEKIQNYLQEQLARIIGKEDAAAIDKDMPLMDLGIDSIMALEIKKQLEADTGQTMRATLIFDYPTIEKIASHFAASLYDEAEEAAAVSSGQYHGEPIAIVGIGSKLPKAPNGPGDFWQLLKNGECGINDVPEDRWDIDKYLDKNPDVPGKAYTLSAGLVDDIESFDGKLFGIAPRELESMEPQQRLVLEAAWSAIENSGYAPNALSGSATGVFVGVGANEYIRSCATSAREEDIMFIPTGNALNVIAGRVAFNLGLNGPCMAVDTACSSSAVAIHLAAQSLRNGECSMALAGGVNAMIMPETFVALSKAHMLSKEGRCKTFDESADGYVRGEGVGMLALKRLSDAERDNDNIIAVIKGSAMNQDGRSSSLTAPNGPAQENVIRAALANAGLTTDDVDWVETHGTATPLGDPIEVQALESVYCKNRSADNPLIISSVKTNLGHLESAAGVSSVMKAALSLHHEEIPPHLHFKKFNPHIAVDAARFVIPTENRTWERSERKRRVGVSSFGFSGTNVHLILEEAPQRNQTLNDTERQHHVLCLSGKTEGAVLAQAKQFSDFLQNDNLNAAPAALGDIAFTTNTCRQHFEHRLAIVAGNKDQAAKKLAQLAEGVEVPGSFKGNSQPAIKPFAWLFTGQGSQYVGMAQALYEHNPAFKESLDRCDQLMRQEADVSLLDILWGELSSELDNTQYTQPAIFALQVCLAQQYLAMGIKPELMLGHSVGEFAAAVVAGIMTLEDAMALIIARGRLMVELCESGSMAAVFAPRDQVESLLKSAPELGNAVQIAAVNAPNNTVVSGTHQGVQALVELAAANKVEAKALQVSHAFHSAMMAPMLDSFREKAESIQYQPATMDIISTVTGKPNQGEMSTAAYWVNHVKQPVLFVDALQNLQAENRGLCLEIGPGATLLGLAKQILPQDQWALVHSLRPKQDAERQFSLALAQLYSEGITPDWKAFDKGYHRQRVAVPSYAFDRKRYWLGDKSGSAGQGSATMGEITDSVLNKLHSPMSDDVFFENNFGVQTPFNLDDHRLYEVVVAPGAFHIANALLCAREVFGDKPVKLDDVIFPEPFILEEGQERRLHYGFKKQADKQNTEKTTDKFEVKGFSRHLAVEKPGSNDWQMHTSMMAESCEAADKLQILTDADIKQLQDRATHIFDGTMFYEEMDKVGYQLGPQFRWIKQFWRRPGETLTKLRLPESALEQGKFIIHPGLLDSCFQSSALATMHEDFDASKVDSIYIPFALEDFRFFGKPTTELWCHVKIKNPPDDPDFKVESYSHTIQVYDENGNILIDLDTLHSKRAPKEALLRALNKDPFAHHYDVHWKTQSAKADEGKPLAGTYLVVGEESLLATHVLQALRNKEGVTAWQICCDDYAEFSQQEQSVHLQPGDVGHWSQALAAAGGLKAINGIVYLAPDAHKDESVMAVEKRLFNPMLSLLKSLQLQSSSNPPRLWCVTESAVFAARSDTRLNPSQTALLGFGKVLDMEHSEYESVLIDVDSESVSRNAQQIVAEMEQPAKEKQVALRRGSRLVARLAKVGAGAAGMPIPDAPYRLVVEKKGTFDELKFVPFQPRELGSTQVAVKVLSAGLNFRDVMGVLDVYPGEPGPLGGECIGEVIELGADVTDFKVGDRVMVPLTESCMSTQTISEELLTCRVPENLTLNEASTIPVAYCTALHGLKNIAGLKKGERVLIHAGAGGVGLAAIYIARHMGAEVFATASEKKRDFLRKIGVEHVFDSRSLDFAQQIREATDGEGVDVVLNSLAGEFITKSMELLNAGGRFVEIGKADIWTQDRVKAFRDDISYEAFDLVIVTFNDPKAVRQLMDEIVANIEAGHYQPLPYTVFKHKEAVDAFRYMAQGKHIGKILINPDDSAISVRNDAAYLITGGSGGLGLLFADWLAQQGAGEIVLAARRDVREVNPDAVKRLESQGSKVTCMKADMGHEEDIRNLMQTVSAQSLPLKGVLHAAGVLSDAFLMNQDLNNFEKVMAPKLAAAWHLHEATQAMELDMFVLFSSLSSLLGAPGQANYAAANAFLDGLAHYRRAQGLPAIAINWGPWGEVGMAANSQVEANAAASGVSLIAPEDGLHWFSQVLETNPVQRGLMVIDWGTLANLSGQVPAFLSELDVKANAGMDEALQKMADEFRAMLADAPIQERTPLLIDKICEQIQRVMGLEESDIIDPNQPLQELGLDSLMAVELRNILCALIGKQLPATLMFKYPTVASLSGFLIGDMFPDEAASEDDTSSEQDTAQASGDASAEDDDIDDLSDDELAAMLEEELGDDDDDSNS